MNTDGRIHSRRWLRFRLRTLLIAVVVVACLLGWARMRMDRAKKLREAVALIHSLSNNRIQYDHDRGYDRSGDTPAYNSALGVMESEPPGPRWLREWLGDEYFVTPYRVWVLGYSPDTHLPYPKQLNDDKLRLLVEAMPTLTRIDLWGTAVTDDGCLHLSELKRLEHIQLADSIILTDNALAGLEITTTLKRIELFRCPNLTWLGVRHLLASRESVELLHASGEGFSDNEIEVVKNFPSLKELNLVNCQVSDRSLPVLKSMTTLTRLQLTNSLLSEESVEQLKYAMPCCKVLYSPSSRSPVGPLRQESE